MLIAKWRVRRLCKIEILKERVETQVEIIKHLAQISTAGAERETVTIT